MTRSTSYNLVVFIFLTVCFLLLSVTRKNFGTDLASYIEMIEANAGEVGFRYFASYLASLGFASIDILNILVFLSISLKMIFLFKVRKDSLIPGLFVLLPIIIAKDFGTIRQGIGLSILLFATILPKCKGLTDPKGLNLIFLLVIASLFHWSSSIGYILFLILNKLTSFQIKYVLPIGIATFAVLNKDLIYSVSQLIPIPLISYKLSRYLNYSDAFDFGFISSAIFIVAEGFIFFILSMNAKNPILLGSKLIDRGYILKFIFALKMMNIYFLWLGVGQFNRAFNLSNIYLSFVFLALLLRNRARLYTVTIYCIVSFASTFLQLVRYTDYYNEW